MVGTDIVRYDIYGKDVYIANKFESNSLPGSILISEDTMEILQSKFINEFEFEQHKDIELPVSGEIRKSFFVRQKPLEEEN
jgi:class 3 adenylate cyclase